jgi:hypothetical protein
MPLTNELSGMHLNIRAPASALTWRTAAQTGETAEEMAVAESEQVNQ